MELRDAAGLSASASGTLLQVPAGGVVVIVLPFFSEVYCNVLRGDGHSVFEQGGDVARRRALLLIWPNNADSADNPHLCRAGGASRARSPHARSP